jgi:hypothetical protein
MDEELERWARAWQSMEIKHVNIMKRAQAAHRQEAIWQGMGAAAVGFGVLVVAIGFASVAASGLSGRWHFFLIPALSLPLAGWTLWRSGQQAALARARLVATPVGFVTDLMRLRERELAWYVDKRVLLAAGVLQLATIAFGVDIAARARAAGEPRTLVEGLLGSLLLFLVASVIFGIRRVRYLRRDLATLRELRSELEPEQ